MSSVKKYSIALTATFLLAGCASQPPAISFYDSCAAQTSSFAEMAACGKQARNAYCAPHQTCSPDGNAFVMYTDSLAKSVADGQMTEDEAQRKWIEFRAAQVNAEKERSAILQTQTVANCCSTD